MTRRFLMLAAALSFKIALLHVAIVFIGASAYRYFGAGEAMARNAEQGSLQPAAITFFIASVFALFGLYALSGAGVVLRLPLLKTTLATITAIYLLRGFLVFPQVLILAQREVSLWHRDICFSLASLLTGLVHLCGIIALVRSK